MVAPDTQCIPQLTLPHLPKLSIVIEFDAPEISSDGEALLLRKLDDELGLTAGFAQCLSDNRDPDRVSHPRHEQARVPRPTA